MIDIIYETHVGDHVSYRLSPNPDAPPGEGYRSGAVLEWKDPGVGEKWQGYFFISPECLSDLSDMLRRASEDVDAPR